jgi:hypothetical protein
LKRKFRRWPAAEYSFHRGNRDGTPDEDGAGRRRSGWGTVADRFNLALQLVRRASCDSGDTRKTTA